MEVQLIGQPLTKGYEHVGHYLAPGHTALHRYPPFTLGHVSMMLLDARVRFGLELIKGPILTKGQFEVKADNDEVAEFVKETLDTFKLFGQQQALNSLAYGWSCSEVMYEVRNGYTCYKELKPLHPTDCRVLKSNRTGNLAGALVRVKTTTTEPTSPEGEIVLGGPKALWSVHNRDYHPWYGLSRLFGAFLPWLEKWSDGGARDIRRLGFYKQAFDGGTIEHPPGETLLNTLANGQVVTISNRDLARKIIENLRTGGVLVLPYVSGPNGQNLWKYTPGTNGVQMEGIQVYIESLDDEIWEGMGVVKEVAKSPGSSGSYGGRSVAEDAMGAILHGVFCENTTDFVKQVVHPLVILRFGFEKSWFQVKPYGLLQDPHAMEGAADAEIEPGQPNQPGKPGQSPAALSLEEENKIIIPLPSPVRDGVRRGISMRNWTIQGGGRVNYA